jgi:regulator of protease activity HflC (stomatin/prohibitin superfamily)
MNTILFFISWIGFIALMFGLVGFLIYWSSRHGKPEDRLLFTECPFSKGMIVSRGSRPMKVITGGKTRYNDEFILVNKVGKPFDEINDLDITGEIKNPDSFLKATSSAGKAGINLIGVPWIDRVKIVHYTWNELEKKDVKTGKIDTSEYNVVPHDDRSSFFSILKTYAILADGLEMGSTKEGITEKEQIDIVLSVTVLIVDPMKAIALINWYKGVSVMIKETCNEYCGDNTLDTLINQAGKDLIAKVLCKNQEFLRKYGVLIYQISYNGYDYSGANSERIRAKSTERWEAEQDAQRVRVMADGDAYKIRETGKAEADVITIRGSAEAGAIKAICDAGSNAPLIATAHAIRDTKLTTFVQGGSAGSTSVLVGGTTRP